MDITKIFTNFINECRNYSVITKCYNYAVINNCNSDAVINEDQCVCVYHPNTFGFIIYNSKHHDICHLCGNKRELNAELFHLKNAIDNVLNDVKLFDKTKLKNNLESIHVVFTKQKLMREIKNIFDLIVWTKTSIQKKYICISLFRLLIENRSILLDADKKFKAAYLNKCIELSYDYDIFRAYYEYITFSEFPL